MLETKTEYGGATRGGHHVNSGRHGNRGGGLHSMSSQYLIECGSLYRNSEHESGKFLVAMGRKKSRSGSRATDDMHSDGHKTYQNLSNEDMEFEQMSMRTADF